MSQRPTGRQRPPSRATAALLWLLALALTLAAASYQRRTGPTYPLSGSAELAGESFAWELPRSAETSAAARPAVAAPAGVTGRLLWRRYPTGEPFTALPLTRRDGELSAELPVQPPAGKVEYLLVLDGPGAPAGGLRLPGGDSGSAVLRYKGPVPGALLLAHVLLMFIGLLVGLRAALGAVAAPAALARLAAVALAALTLGGMVLGPFVQKAAFGAYWTGFPFGGDLTDNKTLLMWLAWLAACAVLRWRGAGGAGRAAVVLAAVVTIGVYLVPHSLRGSELDYRELDRGVAAAEAIG